MTATGIASTLVLTYQRALIGIAASAGYYLFNIFMGEKTVHQSPPLSADRVAFLKAKNQEIEDLYDGSQNLEGAEWKMVGEGSSKRVYEHPSLPGMVIKVPLSQTLPGIQAPTCEGDLKLHFQNLEAIRPIAALFPRIVLPESYLYETSRGIILVEQKFNLLNCDDILDSPDSREARRQFVRFIKAADLYDVSLFSSQNVGIINQPGPMQFGIFDFDHKYKQKTIFESIVSGVNKVYYRISELLI
jgi:hypothetical protein